MLIELDVFGTLTAASLVLLAGRKLVASWRVLNTYSIPEPVVGGLAVALLFWLAHAAADVQIRFDSTLGPPLMLAFFACIGLNADLPSLLRGGRPLVVFLGVVLGFLILQNITGMGLAYALGQSPLVGLLAGSISLSGGHGTGAAWGAVFAERYGLASAKEIAIAAATFGLVLGGVIGGPVARHLLTKVPGSRPGAAPAEASTVFEHPGEVRLITAPAMIETLALISVCLLAGQYIARALAGTFLELPAFVCVLFVGRGAAQRAGRGRTVHGVRARRVGAGQCLAGPVPGDCADVDAAVGAVQPGAADAGPAGRADGADGGLRHLRHLPGRWAATTTPP